jgi:hypothetical protein
MNTYGVPSGIGDVSWIYSKLKHCGPAIWEVADGWPHRTAPYLKLLDNVVEASYGQFTYNDILRLEHLQGYREHAKWNDIERKQMGRILIECNQHLEMGRRLEDWLPDLECDFHYPINIPEDEKARAVKLLSTLKRPIWGISAASYRGSEAWKTWGYEEWKDFLKRFEAEFGGTVLLMGGFWDDLTSTLASEGYRDIVGKTSVPAMVHVLDLIDGYIGFSSGMGIIRTVLKKPVFMMWPDHQIELSTSWAPQWMLDEDRYMTSLWRSVDLVFKRVKIWMERNHL